MDAVEDCAKEVMVRKTGHALQWLKSPSPW
jgi:hypothetical protein